MTDDDVRAQFVDRGFVILAGLLPPEDLAPAVAQLATVFPNADEFHDDVAPDRNARYRSEFGGIIDFPFPSAELSRLAVHDRLVDVASELLGSADLRLYGAEAWAKYTGAVQYEQPLHRDYLNHSLVVPAPDQPPCQVEMFLYLSDVDVDLGPPAYVPLANTHDLPPLPNWYPRDAGASDRDHPTWVSPDNHQELYDDEIAATGPAGTVVAYRIETFHRATELRRPRGARYTIHVNFRLADAEWITRRAWTDRANSKSWHAFVTSASDRQLQLFGFPPPGHPYWTDATRRALQLRYPGIDVSPWTPATSA